MDNLNDLLNSSALSAKNWILSTLRCKDFMRL
jgi:hypothetical protein